MRRLHISKCQATSTALAAAEHSTLNKKIHPKTYHQPDFDSRKRSFFSAATSLTTKTETEKSQSQIRCPFKIKCHSSRCVSYVTCGVGYLRERQSLETIQVAERPSKSRRSPVSFSAYFIHFYFN